MAKYTTYASHKATNITGLENIPEHWEIKQVRYLLLDGQDGIKIGPFGSALKLEDMVEAGYKVYGQENVIKKDFSLGKRWISENKFNAMQVYRVHSGDILITMMGTSGKCEIVPDDHQTGIIDSHLIRLGLQKDKMLPKFFKVLIDGTLEIEYQVKIQGKGSIMHGLNSSIIKSLELPIPPLSEQKDILNFLDHETAQIDTLIEKQQTLIQLLKEKRQAVISHAVTRGLNPDVPMKDSGVEWLGEVPSNWLVLRFKHILKIMQGMAFKSSEYVDVSSVVNIRMGNIKKGGYIDLEHNTKYLPEVFKDIYSRYQLNEGDAIIAMTDMSPTLDFLAVPAILEGLDKSFVYLLNQRVGKIIPNKGFDIHFIKYWLLSTELRMQLKLKGLGTVQSNMSNDDLYNSYFFCPPPSERINIVEFLNHEIKKIDTLLNKQGQLVELLQERRTALISAAVTGKIDVRGWQAPDVIDNVEVEIESIT